MLLSKLPLLISANFPVVAIDSPTPERMAVLEYIVNNCGLPNNLPVYVWNVGQAVLKQVVATENKTGILLVPFEQFKPQVDSRLEVLNFMLNCKQSGIFVLENLHPWLNGQSVVWQIISQLTNIYHEFSKALNFTKRCILLSDGMELHPSLVRIVPLVENSLPNEKAIAQCTETYIKALKTSIDSAGTPRKLAVKLSKQDKDNLVRAAGGLTLEEIRAGLRLIAMSKWNIDSETPELMAVYKEDKLKTSLGIQITSKPDVPTFGGLEILRQDMKRAFRRMFDPKAREFGLPIPKGIALVGCPGTGKSLSAKVIAAEWNLPLISLDWGSLYGGIVGESQANWRRLRTTVEAIAPCVLCIDELDKAFAGHNTANDGGVTQQLIGSFLTWMQEKTSPVYVIATLNRIERVPEEVLRKGRFDEIYLVDLPNTQERIDIFRLHLARYKAEFSEPNLKLLAEETAGCSGSEIAGLVDAAADDGFNSGLNTVSVSDILNHRRNFKPLSEWAADSIRQMRDWAARSASPASLSEGLAGLSDGHLSPSLLIGE